jgi:hypothetical protein
LAQARFVAARLRQVDPAADPLLDGEQRHDPVKDRGDAEDTRPEGRMRAGALVAVVVAALAVAGVGAKVASAVTIRQLLPHGDFVLCGHFARDGHIVAGPCPRSLMG